MAEDTYDYLLKAAKGDYDEGALKYGASGFSKIAGGMINYSSLKTEAAQLKTQALSIEQQARERANLIREQFIEAMGAYQLNAAQRGISVGSMSVRNNLENSAANLSNDIAKDKRNASMKANALRAQAKIAKIQGKYEMFNQFIEGGEDLAKSAAIKYMSGGMA